MRLRLVAAALVAVVMGAWVGAPAPLTSRDPAALAITFREDAKLIDAHGRALDASLRRLKRAQVPPEGDVPLSAGQEKILVDTWRSLLDNHVALEGLRRFYEDYYRFDFDSRRDDHVSAFLLTFAADATQQDVSERFIKRVRQNANAVKLLNAKREGLARRQLQHLSAKDHQLRRAAASRSGA